MQSTRWVEAQGFWEAFSALSRRHRKLIVSSSETQSPARFRNLLERNSQPATNVFIATKKQLCRVILDPLWLQRTWCGEALLKPFKLLLETKKRLNSARKVCVFLFPVVFPCGYVVTATPRLTFWLLVCWVASLQICGCARGSTNLHEQAWRCLSLHCDVNELSQKRNQVQCNNVLFPLSLLQSMQASRIVRQTSSLPQFWFSVCFDKEKDNFHFRFTTTTSSNHVFQDECFAGWEKCGF